MQRRLTKSTRLIAAAAAVAAAGWIAAYCAITIIALPTLKTSFYGSIAPSEVARLQREIGVRSVSGPTWIHLGWIADPHRERYRVLRKVVGGTGSGSGTSNHGRTTAASVRWLPVAEARFGSALLTGLELQTRYELRVEAVDRATGKTRVLGTLSVATTEPSAPIERPVIASQWRTLFRPRQAGDYVNDHCLFRDASGRWRLWGITGPGPGDYRREVRFAQGVLSGPGGLASGEMT
ncbi:MAG: hypothetical protein D6760_12965, partial [Deltaproteobacteria bacterium]